MLNRILLVCGAVVIAGLVGFAIGRASKPTRIQERLVEDTAARERVKELSQQVENLKKNVRVEIVEVVRPDGTKEKKTTTDVKIDKTTTGVKTVTVDREVEKRVEIDRLVDRSRPDWRVGPMIGFDVRTGTLGYGGQIERRIAGPFSIGVWGMTPGVFGLTVGLEF